METYLVDAMAEAVVRVQLGLVAICQRRLLGQLAPSQRAVASEMFRAPIATLCHQVPLQHRIAVEQVQRQQLGRLVVDSVSSEGLQIGMLRHGTTRFDGVAEDAVAFW